MKRCPVCEKTFDDSMRFCQTDGTPLEADAPPAEDPYKTMVAGKDEIAAAIPPPSPVADPFKTMVAGSSSRSKEDGGDLLQIPDEDAGGFDALKTMVNPPNNVWQVDELSKPIEPPKEEIRIEPIKDSAPPSSLPAAVPSPFDNAATPSQPPVAAKDKFDAFSSNQPPPAPPKFNEPNIAPPSFPDMNPPPAAPPQSGFSSGGFMDDSSASNAGDRTEIYPSNPLPPLSKESSEPPPTMLGGDSPFDKPMQQPSSPFNDSPKPAFETPASSSPPPFSPYKEPKEPEAASPFDNQSNPFSQPNFNQGENINQNMQQQDWNPPPAPDSNWQNQNVGQNTPFQPPAAGGQNQVLPIISLVLGILSICCYISPLTGIAALITGFLGMKNAKNNPNQYGGKGLAIAGMITGGIFFLLGVIYYVLIFLGVAMGSFQNF